MSAELLSELERERERERPLVGARSRRARLVGALGPATILAGVVWALLQPERLTILHPRGQGFWWLVSEPPLLVVAVGILFHRLLARGLIEDLER